jgi:hypothetical protein
MVCRYLVECLGSWKACMKTGGRSASRKEPSLEDEREVTSLEKDWGKCLGRRRGRWRENLRGCLLG